MKLNVITLFFLYTSITICAKMLEIKLKLL